MSYIVFARKYRPQKFEDVVGQEHVTRTLRNAIRNNRTGSGYLFCGPRGTGKTTCARLLAKALNCVHGPTPDPCGECPACIEITKGSSLDVLEIDAASNTGVDDIRTLRENVRYLPTGGKKRIYIIDEVHRLSGAAFDALLKTLEEPPEHVLFIFATTEPMKVPETILSRTQRFDFKRVSLSDLIGHLRRIADAEKLNIDDAAIALLARKADGSVRDSLSLLDQLAAFAGDEIGEAEVIEALGLVDRQFLFDFTSSIAAKESAKLLELVRRIFDSGIDPRDFVAEYLEHLRVILVLTTDPSTGDILNLNAAELEEYQQQAENFSVGDVIRLMKMAADLNRDLKDSGLDERLLMEMTAVKMAEMEATVKFEEVLSIMNQNPAGVAQTSPDLFNGAQKKKSSPVAGGSSSALPKTPPPVYSRSVNIAILNNGWDSFMAVLKQKNRMLATQLSMADLTAANDNQLTLVFPSSGEVNRQIVQRAENLSLITSVLREHFKANISIRFEIDPDKPTPIRATEENNGSSVDLKKLVEESPRIRELMEKVNGEIIGVKKIK